MCNVGFGAETELFKGSPTLHHAYTRCVQNADKLLVRFHDNFPDYTDHSLLHALEVTNLCNQLVAPYTKLLGAHELYILLMGALLHDVGMGIDAKHFERYYSKLCPKQPLPSPQECPVAIRKLHHEFSALFIVEHRRRFFIPDMRYAKAIAAVARGHRDVELGSYDAHYPIKDGQTANLPYLAAVVRLADELDISATRNPSLQYAGFIPSNSRSALEFQKHRSVTSAQLQGSVFVISAATDDRQEYDELMELCRKISTTLTYCRRVALQSGGYTLPVEAVKADIQYVGCEEAGLYIEVDRAKEALTLRLRGRLDANTSPRLEEKLVSVLSHSVKRLDFDFAGVDYVSSAGLRVILSAKKKMLEQQGEMSVQKVCDEVMKVFRMTGFSTIIDICPS